MEVGAVFSQLLIYDSLILCVVRSHPTRAQLATHAVNKPGTLTIQIQLDYNTQRKSRA